MTRFSCSVAALVVVSVIAGCGDDDGGGGDIDAGGDPVECDDDNPCADGVCSPDNECVDCLIEADCTGDDEGLVCGEDNTCVSCTASAQCESEACVAAGGRCAAEADVAYVIAGGTGTDCSLASPCGTLNTAVATDRPFVMLRGEVTIVDSELSVIDGKTVTVSGTDGNGALSRNTAGSVVEVSNAGNVTFAGLEIHTGLGGAGHGLNITGTATVTLDRVLIQGNAGFGVVASVSGGHRVTMDRCLVVGNSSGGVNIQGGAFQLTNNLIVNNGSGASLTGGMTIDPGATDAVFEFNTVANNVSSTATSGVNCVNSFAASSNIVTGNAIGAMCTFEFSLFDVVTPGTGNLAGDPGFLNVNPLDPLGAQFYRIDPFSPAVDSGNPDGESTIDIDGDTRPIGGRKDMGADEAM